MVSDLWFFLKGSFLRILLLCMMKSLLRGVIEVIDILSVMDFGLLSCMVLFGL